MKALIYKGISHVEPEIVHDPVLSGTDGAIVRVTMSGICGSDLHQYHVDPGVGEYCIGHEAVGEVVEVGSAVTKFAAGDRVIVPAILGCGACTPCLEDTVTMCQTYGPRILGQGTSGLGGCQAELVEVPVADHNLIALPAGLSDDIGIMLSDNLATAWYFAKRARVSAGDTVAVIGLGPVGMLAVLSALAMGAKRVLAVDLVAERRKRAELLGAESVEDSDAVQGVLAATQGLGVDVVLDANGGPVTVGMAVAMVRPGGRVAMIGVPETPEMSFPIVLGIIKALEFHAGICPVHAQIPELLDAISAGRLDTEAIESLITHRMGMSEGAEAFALFDAREDDVLKVVLDPAR
ncbi:zinc-binding dehydrogenase [Mycobacterium sp. NPDC051198]